jgi:hypothetical protein
MRGKKYVYYYNDINILDYTKNCFLFEIILTLIFSKKKVFFLIIFSSTKMDLIIFLRTKMNLHSNNNVLNLT